MIISNHTAKVDALEDMKLTARLSFVGEKTAKDVQVVTRTGFLMIVLIHSIHSKKYPLKLT